MIKLLFAGLVILFVRHRFFWKARHRDFCPNFMAHRGIKIHSPENTISSYQEALQNGFKGIELDVISLKDDTLVCSHNYDLERETDGFGWFYKKDKTELDRVCAGIRTHPQNTQPVPQLEEALSNIPKNIFLNFEIKVRSLFDLSTATTIRRMIQDQKIAHPFMISSFSPLVVAYFRLFCQNVTIGYLVKTPKWIWPINWIHPDYLHPRADIVNDEVFKMSKNHRLPLNLWTVNNIPAIEWCRKNNVNSVITDNPACPLQTT